MINKTFVLVHPSFFERKTDLSDDDIAEILRSEDQNEDRYIWCCDNMSSKWAKPELIKKDKSKDLSFFLEKISFNQNI